MKVRIILTLLAVILLMAGSFWMPTTAEAQSDCFFGCCGGMWHGPTMSCLCFGSPNSDCDSCLLLCPLLV